MFAVFLALLLTWTGADFRLALPGYQFEFPRDHGNHPEFKLEWWYFTGNLESSNGRRFGYELTFFRTGLIEEHPVSSAWSSRDVYPAHFALSDLSGGQFHFFERLTRPGPGFAGAAEGDFKIWNRDWKGLRSGDGSFHLEAREVGIELELDLTPLKAPVIHGIDGVSQKAEGRGRASHYYSLTRLRTQGTLRYQEQEFRLSGLSWMDHEFGTNQLAEEQIGWDWFSLQFESGEELMIYQLRRADGSPEPASSGTWVDQHGKGIHLSAGDFQLMPGRQWKSSVSKGSYPVEWVIRIAPLELELEVGALMDDQELSTLRSTGVLYWEGAVRATGNRQGRPIAGRGYLEMTGYAPDSRPDI